MLKPRATLYLIGSLRTPDEQWNAVARPLREALPEIEFFDDWRAAGPIADDSWRDYEKARGRSYAEALDSYAAAHVFDFDHHHLSRSHGAILIMPSGKSAHLELGWMLGQKKPGYVLLDSPERWEVMLKFSAGVYDNMDALIERLQKDWMT